MARRCHRHGDEGLISASTVDKRGPVDLNVAKEGLRSATSVAATGCARLVPAPVATVAAAVPLATTATATSRATWGDLGFRAFCGA